MKVNSQKIQDIEKNNNEVKMKPEDNEVISDIQMPFSDVLQREIVNDGVLNENSVQGTAGIDFNYDTLLMDIDDAKFFINLAKEGQFSIVQEPNGNIQSVVQLSVSQTEITKKAFAVTNQLTELIEKAQSTQKPVRISFDNDVSVVLKIDKHGKITAEFIPGSIEVENYLKNNISALRQRFDEQNLPYNDLYYRQNERQNNKRRNKGRGEQ